MSASDTLRALRHACGLGQEQWAAFVGVGRKTVQRWESGAALPDARAEAAIVELCAERGVADQLGLARLLGEARMGSRAPARAVVAAGPPQTALLGRSADIRAVLDALAVSRLVTLVGPAGVGKTSLAFAVADTIDGPSARILLAQVDDVELVLPAIASALAVRQTRDRSLRDTVVAGLRMSTVLVLDNCEHLPLLGAIVDDLLRSCAALRILATSRAALHRLGEYAYVVEPLTPPAAVELFRRAARSTAPNFEVTEHNRSIIGELCDRLDRLPLAIELIASRVRVASAELLLEHVDRRLDLLRRSTAGEDDRHASLAAALAWSYELLADGPRRLLRSLGVFAGSFTAEAAAAVSGHDLVGTLDGLDILLDHHLIRPADDRVVSRGADARLSMLQSVRAFALDKLAIEGETTVAAAAHAVHHAALAAREAARLHGHEQLAALDRLRASDADIVAALVWLLSNDVAAALDLAVALAPYWDTISALSEGRSWLIRAVSAAGDDASWIAVATASTWSSYFAALRGEFDAAERMASTALQMWEGHGIDAGRGYALLMLGFAAVERGDLDSGERLLTASAEALERSGDRWGHARPLNNLGELARMRGDLDRAERLHGHALAIVRDVGDLGSQPNMLCGLGHVHLARGEVSATRSLAREAIEISERLGNRLGTASTLELLGLADHHDDPKGAARLLGAASSLRDRLGAPVESRDRPLVDAARRHLEHTEEWHAGAATPLEEILVSALR